MKPLEAKRNESTKRNGEESNLFKFNVRDNRVAASDFPFQSRSAPRLRFIALLSGVPIKFYQDIAFVADSIERGKVAGPQSCS